MEIPIILLLILLNGLFAMSEVALISARRSRLESEAARGNRAARRALELSRDPDRFLSTIQIGITLIGIMTGIYSGAALADRGAEWLAAAGIPMRYAHAAAQTLIVVAVTYLTLVLGELVPKRIGLGAAERVAKAVARPMRWLSLAASPFVWLLARSTSAVARLLRLGEGGEKVTEEEIRSLVREGRRSGEVREVEQRIVDRVFSLGDRTVGQIMTHRNDLKWIEANASAAEILDLVAREPHNRYPVAEGSIDRTTGIVLLKDVFSEIGREDFRVRDVMRPAHFFHEEMDVYNALEQLRDRQADHAIVCDEFGVTQGIVTLRDILEALVGVLPDGGEEPDIVARPDGSFFIDGQCPFYDFLLHFSLEDLLPDFEFNTVGGLVLEALGHIPHTGERFEWNGLSFEVADMDGARIDRLIVRKLPETASEA